MGILGELWVKLGLKNDGLKKGLNDSKKEVSGFASAIKKVGGLIGAAFSVKAIVDFTHQTAELANKASGVKKAFDKLNSPGLLADLRRATMGTVDDLQLMQRAVQANNFKIPLNQLATYLEFATKRANETGESVDYLVNSIITGLGRQSIMILDNLGISAAEIHDRMKEGGTMADAVGKIIKEQMGEGVAEIDKATLATERLNAAWTNFQLAFGSVTSGAWNWIKGQLADVLEETTGILNSNHLNKWQKFFALNPFTGGIMRAAGTIDRALEADKVTAAKEAEAAAAEAAAKAEKEAAEEAKIKAAEEAKRKSQIITYLKEEISAKEQLRDLSANEDEIRQLNDEIAAMKERLKVLQMTTEEYRKYRNEKMTPIPEMNSGLEGLFDTEYLKQNIDKGSAMLEEAQKQWTAKGAALAEITMEQQNRLTEAAQMLANALTSGISNSLTELANVIAGVEGANAGNVVKALLTPLADAAISAGLMIITTGKAVEAFKASLSSLNGVVGIAAGAALIAVGMAAKAGLAAIGNNPTGGGYANAAVTSYSGGYGVNSANYAQNDDFSLSTTLKGQDLLLSIERTQNNKRR
jgi:hypothetical protein